MSKNIKNRAPGTASKILKVLSELYPDAESELEFKSPYQLLVAVILSAQCTDKKVNEVTPELFGKYTDFESLSLAKLTAVEKIIRPVNYYKTKSKNLIAMAKQVCEVFSGKIPQSHADLISLPGVGNKTANVVRSELGFGYSLPVDTHVKRVSMRLGLSSGKNADSVESELKAIFKPETWRQLHHGLIFHGRRVCKAQNPLCSECKLDKLCPSKS